ncbi:hypothetical protein ACFX13_017504 [Malus domestica]
MDIPFSFWILILIRFRGSLGRGLGCSSLGGLLGARGEGEGLVSDLGDAAGLVDFFPEADESLLVWDDGELAGADWGVDDGADLVEEDGEDGGDLADGAGPTPL